MSKEYLSPKSDLIFKMIFGDEKNVDILTAFLKSVLNISIDEYQELKIVDPHLKLYTPNDKLGVLDIKIITKNGISIDIEIQIVNVPQMRERIVFYTSKMITEQISKGESYEHIKKVISIVITDYTLIKENSDYHNTYRLYDKITGSEFTDVLEINTLELSKLPQNEDKSELWNWLAFLKSKKEEEFKMIAQKSPELNKAVCVLAQLSQDEKTKLLAEEQEKAQKDYNACIKGAYDSGIEKGIEKGMEKGTITTLIKLIGKYGISVKSAMEDVGLDEKYKEEIINELQNRGIKYIE